MKIVPFRSLSSLLQREATRRPPMRHRSPDRWDPPGWSFVWKLWWAGSLVIVLVLAYRDLREHVPEWMRPYLPLHASFEIIVAGQQGPGRVVDGDTLALGDLLIRLQGIDAPEIGQTCRLGQREFDCGLRAARVLKDYVAGDRVRCHVHGSDRYGRTLATCVRSDGHDLARHLVAFGWALAYRQYSHAYVADEEAARRDGLGLWAGTFANPHSWRSGQR